jgi:hypothetical protein
MANSPFQLHFFLKKKGSPTVSALLFFFCTPNSFCSWIRKKNRTRSDTKLQTENRSFQSAAYRLSHPWDRLICNERTVYPIQNETNPIQTTSMSTVNRTNDRWLFLVPTWLTDPGSPDTHTASLACRSPVHDTRSSCPGSSLLHLRFTLNWPALIGYTYIICVLEISFHIYIFM